MGTGIKQKHKYEVHTYFGVMCWYQNHNLKTFGTIVVRIEIYFSKSFVSSSTQNWFLLYFVQGVKDFEAPTTQNVESTKMRDNILGSLSKTF